MKLLDNESENREIKWCKNNANLSEEERGLCENINEKFSELKKTLEDSLKTGNNKIVWQTTPIIGYQETVYKKRGVIIIGINENDRSKGKDNAKCQNMKEDSNFTGNSRDNVLGCYRYFKFFTEDGILKRKSLSDKFDHNIKFMELIPIKTNNGKGLENVLKKSNDIEIKCYCYLREMLELLDPELIIVNSVEVSDLFKQQGSKEGIENQEKDVTNIIIDINNNKVPVILSGQVTGRNHLDRYNIIRFWNEIERVL